MIASKKSKNPTISVSAKKREAMEELSNLDIKLSDGSDYVLREYTSSKTTLADARKRLSSIKTSISKEIREE